MNGSYDGPDRREHERLPCEGVLLSYSKPTFLSSVFGSRPRRGRPLPVRNIARGGLCFLSRKALQPGQRFRLAVRFGRKGHRFWAEARAAWSGPGRGRYPTTVGACFTRLDRHAWNTLGRLEELLARQGVEATWKDWRLRAKGRRSKIWGERDETLRV